MGLCDSSLICYIPIWLICSWSSVFFCFDVGIIILPSMVMLCYDCYFVSGRPVWVYFLLGFSFHLWPAMQYVIWQHAYVIIIYGCHLWLFPFWVSLCLCLSTACAQITNVMRIVVVLVWTGSLWCIGGCVILFFVVCDRIIQSFLSIATSILWSVFMVTLQLNRWISHEVCLEAVF